MYVMHLSHILALFDITVFGLVDVTDYQVTRPLPPLRRRSSRPTKTTFPASRRQVLEESTVSAYAFDATGTLRPTGTTLRPSGTGHRTAGRQKGVEAGVAVGPVGRASDVSFAQVPTVP